MLAVLFIVRSPANGQRAADPSYAAPAVDEGDDGRAFSLTLADVRLGTHPEGPGHQGCGGQRDTEESAVANGNAPCWSRDEFGTILSELYHTHYRSLVRLAALYLDRAGEDAVQDAFVRVWLQWDRIREADKILVYVRRAVVNNAKSGLKHRIVVRRRVVFFAEMADLPAAPPAPPSEEVALRHLGDEAVVLCLRRLPARQAQCVGLRYYLDLSEKETAEVLGISAGAVKKHMSRARTKLAAVLEPMDG